MSLRWDAYELKGEPFSLSDCHCIGAGAVPVRPLSRGGSVYRKDLRLTWASRAG